MSSDSRELFLTVAFLSLHKYLIHIELPWSLEENFNHEVNVGILDIS